MIGLQFNDIFYVVGTIYLAFILISLEISVVSYIAVLPRIMNFGRIRIPNNICIFKSDEYEYEYYSEF